ncbi:MAG: exopolysaccharide biosynthesis polyprenyl glycosylphosphotransferase [Patescibacteria group bacterium]|nr:exopolysaccharide biosynthesis polyprenyl glycosylphosphotransferase [Patescibacteria group bacterium]
MFGQAKSKALFLLLSDVIVFYIALILTLVLRYQTGFSRYLLNQHLVPFSIIFVVSIIAFYISGLYDLKHLKNEPAFFKILSTAQSINLLIAFAFFYLFPFFGVSPRTNLLLFAVISTSLLIVWRYFFNRLVKNTRLQNVLVIGSTPDIEKVAQYLKTNPQLGLNIKLILKNGIDDPLWLSLPEIIRKDQISTLVIAPHIKKNQEAAKVIFDQLTKGIEILDTLTFYEQIFSKTPLTELEEMWFLENVARKRMFYESIKKIEETFIAFFLTVIFAPFLIIIYLLIKLTSPGPAIYKQIRAGRKEKIFTLYKFRTMRINAEKNGPEWSQPNDERITPIGKILRSSHLDELPQLFNLFKGDISFVGPRPERPEFVRELREKIPFYDIRHIVRPGLTGWAQINYHYGSSIEDAYEKLQYDIFYIKNRSIILDLLIILKTIKTFFITPK